MIASTAVFIRRATATDIPQIRTVLALSLAHDPLVGIAIPDDMPNRLSRVAIFFMGQAERLVLFGHVDVALADNQLIGAPLWLPTGIERLTTLPRPQELTQIVGDPARQESFVEQLAEARKGRQECEGPYLAALGVLDSYRGYGVGARLLDAGHNFFQGQTTWLESANPSNLSLYRRSGYQVTHQAPFAEGTSTMSQLIRNVH